MANFITRRLERDDFRLGISGVFEVVGAFLRLEGCEKLADCRAEGLWGASGGLSQEVLELGEDLFDRVQIGGIFRQEDQLGAGGTDELTHGVAFVAAEIVHDDDVAGFQGGDENRLDIGSEALAVDRAIEKPGGRRCRRGAAPPGKSLSSNGRTGPGR